MQCPKCGFSQADGSTDCTKCGIIFAKWKPPGTPAMPKSGAESAARLRPMAAPASVGLFGDIPCPQCGAATVARANETLQGGAQQAGGLVGALLVQAFMAKRYCPDHGEISSDSFPAEHRSAIFMKKAMTVVSALGIFVGVVVLLALFQ